MSARLCVSQARPCLPGLNTFVIAGGWMSRCRTAWRPMDLRSFFTVHHVLHHEEHPEMSDNQPSGRSSRLPPASSNTGIGSFAGVATGHVRLAVCDIERHAARSRVVKQHAGTADHRDGVSQHARIELETVGAWRVERKCRTQTQKEKPGSTVKLVSSALAAYKIATAKSSQPHGFPFDTSRVMDPSTRAVPISSRDQHEPLSERRYFSTVARQAGCPGISTTRPARGSGTPG